MKESKFMTSNTYYELDDIKDQDRQTYHSDMQVHKIIKSNVDHKLRSMSHYRQFEDLCCKIEKRRIMTDSEIRTKYKLCDEKVLDDFEPFKLKDVLHVDRLTASDIEISVLKNADVDGDELDLDKDMALDEYSDSDDEADENNAEINKKPIEQKEFNKAVRTVNLFRKK